MSEYLRYIASYDDLCEWCNENAPFDKVTQGEQLLEWTKNVGKEMYDTEPREVTFDPWSYIAGYIETKEQFIKDGEFKGDFATFVFIYNSYKTLNRNKLGLNNRMAMTTVMKTNPFSVENRIKYYMGQVYNNKFELNKEINYKNKDILISEIYRKIYEYELVEIFKKNKIDEYEINFLMGDIHTHCNQPTIVKSRPIKNNNVSNNVILLLNKHRHWETCESLNRNFNDIPFEKKNPKAIWRGSTTGPFINQSTSLWYPINEKASRYDLINRWFNKSKIIDVGIVGVPQLSNELQNKVNMFVKPVMKPTEMAKYKYIISVEGNDVATNLKWIMTLNSVVLMPKPTMETWFMEGMLKPYIHFVPIQNDFEDLEDQIKWCEENQEFCKTIIKNANDYVQQFLDELKNDEITKNICERYLNNVKFV